MEERFVSGVETYEVVTKLLQRRRLAHPTAGLYEAGELNYWWGRPRPTDALDQIYWVDPGGEPVAAVLLADFGDNSSLVYDNVTFCPFVMPAASPKLIDAVIGRGLEHAAHLGITSVDMEIDQADEVTRQIVRDRGFTSKATDVLVECWMDIQNRASVTELADGYRVVSRAEATGLPHMLWRSPDDPLEERLRETPLYRPDLDLLVYDDSNQPAAQAMFWFDPVTKCGDVEPVRTADDHQQRGLSRHLLTTGLDLLAAAGAERVAIGYEPDNPASGRLYHSVGFVPERTNDLYGGPTS